MSQPQTAITPTREQDFPEWYQQVVRAADLAENSDVRGCMVIKPWGYGIWERMQRALDDMFKATGHVNAYFPLFIPESFLSKEAEHVEGFAPECAVVTMGGGKVLEERLVVRPTSETIIYSMFAKWVQSYRDLPLLYNQWANVVRWEMRTRLFLRTMEFLWQEGHTAHTTHDEAEEETRRMLGVYREFMEGYMAMPVITGQKTNSEKFAGALRTYACEAMMQDNKALQAGTSHNLGQNFAKAFEIQFQGRDKTLQHAWTTSWGVSTRLIGGVIMTHGDDSGLILPPAVAPWQVVIVPIPRGTWKETVLPKCEEIAAQLKAAGIRVKLDADESQTPGWKFSEYEMRGVPLRLEIGPKDIEKSSVFAARRDTRVKASIPMEGLTDAITALLADIQKSLLERARTFREEHTSNADSYDALKAAMEGRPGFVIAPWCEEAQCEADIKAETQATIRNIPVGDEQAPDKPCIKCGKPAKVSAWFAKAY